MKKTCFVVGYGPGVGHGVAQAFASAGYQLALFSRDPARHEGLREQLSTRAIALPADAADEPGLKSALQKGIETLGSPDVLIYNAVAFRAALPTQLSGQDLVSDFSTNVVGALVSTQAVLPEMQNNANPACTVLFTGGGWALYPDPAVASTAIGKASLRHLALMLHQELRATSVRVGTVTILGPVAPGTPFDPSVIGQTFLSLAQQSTEQFQAETQFTGAPEKMVHQ